jgi:hypothetical protein
VGKRILVVATSNIDADEIAGTVGGRFGEHAEVRVLAPASRLSRLDWLTSAEDEARADAASRAADIADAIPEAVDARVGDVDPLQAIDDAVRAFAPDEVVVVTREDTESSWLESGAGVAAQDRFDVPVTHVVLA